MNRVEHKKLAPLAGNDSGETARTRLITAVYEFNALDISPWNEHVARERPHVHPVIDHLNPMGCEQIHGYRLRDQPDERNDEESKERMEPDSES